MRKSWKQKSVAMFAAITVASQLLSGSAVTSVKANATNQGQQTVDSFETDAVLDFTRTASVSIGTANEGDAREWGVADTPQYFCNEIKKNYLFGSRSFSIFDAETMELVYDSGNQFEKKTAQCLPDYFNCFNNDIEQGSRSQKKGPEPTPTTTPTPIPTATPTVSPNGTPAPTAEAAPTTTIKVGKAQIVSVKKKSGGKLQIKIMKVSKADGYEVKVSTSKKF